MPGGSGVEENAMFETLGGGVVVFLLDRAAKAAAFARDGAAQPELAFGGLCGIRPVRNAAPWAWRRGSPAAWVAAIAAAVLAAWAGAQLDLFATAPARIGLGAALGGALGNLYDRLRHGAVLDFLHCGLRARGRSFRSAFNLADVAIVGGLLCVSVSYVAALPLAWPAAD